MPIIDTDFFIANTYLPQVGQDASTRVNSNELAKKFIAIYEPEILISAFGSKMYLEFATELNANGTIKTTSLDKWKNLLNGSTYVKDGVDYYWKGIVTNYGAYKKSFITNYVWYKYVYEKVTQHTTLGILKADAENAKYASANDRLSDVWNELVKWYGGYDEYVGPRHYIHNGVHFEDYFGTTGNTKEVSLYTFLSDHEADYPDWIFTPLEHKNKWGI